MKGHAPITSPDDRRRDPRAGGRPRLRQQRWRADQATWQVNGTQLTMHGQIAAFRQTVDYCVSGDAFLTRRLDQGATATTVNQR